MSAFHKLPRHVEEVGGRGGGDILDMSGSPNVSQYHFPVCKTAAGYSLLGKIAWLSSRIVAGMWLAKKSWKTL